MEIIGFLLTSVDFFGLAKNFVSISFLARLNLRSDLEPFRIQSYLVLLSFFFAFFFRSTLNFYLKPLRTQSYLVLPSFFFNLPVFAVIFTDPHDSIDSTFLSLGF